MAKIYGYARCSTNETRQDITRQFRDIKKIAGDIDAENIYYEYESGSKENRTEFNKLLAILEQGDTLVCTEVSRLSRSTRHLCEVLQLVQERHICLKIGGFTVDCRENEVDPMTKGMLQMWAVFSEMEKDMISQRVRSGMANARDKGAAIGRPETTIDQIPKTFLKFYDMYRNKEINVADLARLSQVSRPTVYKYIKIIEGTKTA